MRVHPEPRGRVDLDDAAARAWYEESLTIQRELGDRPDMVHSLGILAKIALAQGDYDRARVWSHERLAMAGEAGDTSAIASSLADMAGAAAGRRTTGAAAPTSRRPMPAKEERTTVAGRSTQP